MRRRSSPKPCGAKKPRFLAVDFFCGAGGTTRGLIDAGGYVIAGVDKDARCERTFSGNNVNETLDYLPTRFLNYDIFPKSEEYTRMHPDRPSPTITTKCHSISNGRFGHYDTKQQRGISLREAAVLQSFPENYVFFPTEQIEPIARMIGNAVPPKLARYFARYLINSIELRR